MQQKRKNSSKSKLCIAVRRIRRYNILSDYGPLIVTKCWFLKSKYGGERLRPDGAEARRMPRTPVGLVNHPAVNLIGNYQLRMAA